MQLAGNTVFITGGTSGIGKGLAEAFYQRGNQVIIAGRREARLGEMCGRHPGMRSFVLDVTDPEAIRAVAARAIREFPALNCLINNAGVQMRLGFTPGSSLDDQALQAVGGPGKAATFGAGPQPMPLHAFIAETMKELESGAEELAIAEAKRLVAAAGLETVKQVFAAMNF